MGGSFFVNIYKFTKIIHYKNKKFSQNRIFSAFSFAFFKFSL